MPEYTDTHMSTCKTGKNWIKSMVCITVSFSVKVSYCRYADNYHQGKSIERYIL